MAAKILALSDVFLGLWLLWNWAPTDGFRVAFEDDWVVVGLPYWAAAFAAVVSGLALLGAF